MTKEEIIEAIKIKIGKTYPSIWTIGTTDDPDTHKQQHLNKRNMVKYWAHYKTDSQTTGLAVEQYFLDKGMKGRPNTQGNAGYVYVF